MASDRAIRATPTALIVGPFRYDVTFDGESAYDYGYNGVTLYRSRRVKLDHMLPDNAIAQTVMHEILHALGNAYEIRDWDRHTTDSNQNVTDKIDLMASALLMFLRGNPAVMQWLLRGSEDAP